MKQIGALGSTYTLHITATAKNTDWGCASKSVLVGIYLCLTGILLIYAPLNYLVPDLYAQHVQYPIIYNYFLAHDVSGLRVAGHCTLFRAAFAIRYSKELAPLRIPMNTKETQGSKCVVVCCWE